VSYRLILLVLQFSIETNCTLLKKRIALDTNKIDLISQVVQHNKTREKTTDQEIRINAVLFVATGTEIVTTLLSALTYF